MTDPLVSCRKGDKKLNRARIHDAYLLVGVNEQPLVLCVLTDDGWIEISPVDQTLIDELELCLGDKIVRYPLQPLVISSKEKQKIFEQAQALIKEALENTPTYKK